MISAETWLKDASALDAAEPYTNFSSFFLPQRVLAINVSM
jgi:hypothetical protein